MGSAVGKQVVVPKRRVDGPVLGELVGNEVGLSDGRPVGSAV